MVNGFFRFLLFCVSVCCAAGCADGLLQPSTPASRASAPAGPPQSPATPLAEYRGPETRPFLMGFSQWPADLTDEGIAIAREYAESHGDLVSVMFIGGIPWQEALDGKPFSKNVQDNMSYRPPAGKKLLLSISPLNKDKRDIALYWGDRENQPLPKPWDKEPLNSPRVKKAFLNFVLRAVDAMHPDYLAIGVESNVL